MIKFYVSSVSWQKNKSMLCTLLVKNLREFAAIEALKGLCKGNVGDKECKDITGPTIRLTVFLIL